MTFAAALPGFNVLGRPVTPTFLSRKRFYSQLSPHCPKIYKNSVWEVKKNSRFLSTGYRILQGAWNYGRYIRTCSFRNFTSWLISLSRSTWTIFGKEHFPSKVRFHYFWPPNTVALFAKEARFFRFRVIFLACFLLNKGGDPHFFLHFWHN